MLIQARPAARSAPVLPMLACPPPRAAGETGLQPPPASPPTATAAEPFLPGPSPWRARPAPRSPPPRRPPPPAARGRAAPPGRPGARPAGPETSDTVAGVKPVEKGSTTQHTITIDGKQIAYTANAGTMVLRDADGKPNATVFYIPYPRDQEDGTRRPVTFFFNGGPGSASIWLDMGIMSPRHPNMGPNGHEPAPPYDLVDNPYSPLDVTDLGQIDAMMTGYSRPAPGVKPTEFTGGGNDIAMFGEFIRDYFDKYNRWQSPT